MNLIQMQADLHRAPAVCAMADLLTCNGRWPDKHMRHTVVGTLTILTAFINEHGEVFENERGGRVKHATMDVIDEIVELPGFAWALTEVGWASVDDEGMTFGRNLNVDAPVDGRTSTNVERV